MAAHRYAITHVPGLEEPISRWLTQAGAYAFRCSAGFSLFSSPHAKVSFPWAANAFQVLDEGNARTVEEWMRWLLRHSGWASRCEALARGEETFRLVAMERGRLVGVSPRLLSDLEGMIASATGWSSYRAKPMVEIWAVVRDDGTAALMVRMNKRGRGEGAQPAGALSPDLCAALACLSEVSKGAEALDPFAGHGGIVRALAERGARVACGDADPALSDALGVYARGKPAISAARWDAFAHPWLERGFDAVVTDPPWGVWRPLELPVKEMAAKLAGICAHALRPEGRAVILWAREDALRAALRAQGFYVRRYDILVHGKKAAVWMADRRAEAPNE